LTLATLVDHLIRLECSAESLDTLARATPLPPFAHQPRGRRASGRRWRALLQEMPYDETLFDSRFGAGAWSRTVSRLSSFCAGYRRQEMAFQDRYQGLYGVLALLLLTCYALQESERRRHPPGRSRGEAPGHDCQRHCGVLFADPAVQQSIRWIYRPDDNAEGDDYDGGAVQEWESNVRFDSLNFLRHGTTSVILHGQANRSGGGEFALKLIILPFLRVSQIARSTAGYWATYGRLRSSAVVNVWASSRAWILMDRLSGIPLDEALAHDLPGGNRLRVLQTYGRALFRALLDLSRAAPDRPVHQDLSPSNIIVADGPHGPVLTFVDLGRNYLYSQAIVGLEGAEAHFVAPEVRSGSTATPRADHYSLGYLLIAASGTAPDADGTVPDVFYAHAPLLARFLEDLVDRDPERRLLVSGTEDYDRLGRRFEQEVEAAQAAGAGPLTGEQETTLAAAASLFRPLANSPKRLRRIYRARRRQGDLGDARQNFSARYLLIWAQIAAAAFAVTVVIVSFWSLRDLGWNWGGPAIEFGQRVLGPDGSITDRLLAGRSPDEVPFLDSLRRPGYSIPDLAHNLPARIVGITYALVGAKYYANLFAGIAPLVAGMRLGRLSVLAVGAGFFMRLAGLTAAILVLPFTLVEADWFLVCSALGQTVTFLCNWFAAAFARTAIRRARAEGFSTVPPDDAKVTGMAAFGQWAPSSFYYALVVWTVAVFVGLGVLRDEYVYAIGIAATNLILLYGVKCTAGAANVRIFLTRGTLAAERMRLRAEQPSRHTSNPAR
jgi:hypothetical protein